MGCIFSTHGDFGILHDLRNHTISKTLADIMVYLSIFNSYPTHIVPWWGYFGDPPFNFSNSAEPIGSILAGLKLVDGNPSKNPTDLFGGFLKWGCLRSSSIYRWDFPLQTIYFGVSTFVDTSVWNGSFHEWRYPLIAGWFIYHEQSHL